LVELRGSTHAVSSPHPTSAAVQVATTMVDRTVLRMCICRRSLDELRLTFDLIDGLR
jgi:hypothetical protein